MKRVQSGREKSPHRGCYSLSRRLKRLGRGYDVVEPGHRFGRDHAPRHCRQHELVRFCELICTKRRRSNCELRLTSSAGVDVIAVLQQVAEHGQELGFVQLVQSHTEAAKVGIEPTRNQQTRIPEQDAVGEFIANDKIETIRSSDRLECRALAQIASTQVRGSQLVGRRTP